MNTEYRIQETFGIYYLLFTIYYFSVTQTTVLIWVNPCLKECYLKKQTQFIMGQNDVKSIIIMIYGDLGGSGRQKKQSQFKANLS